MIRAVRNMGRLLSIGRTLARYDALFPLEQLGLSPRSLRLISGLAGLGAKSPATVAEMRPGEEGVS